jgi:hypothetical protein
MLPRALLGRGAVIAADGLELTFSKPVETTRPEAAAAVADTAPAQDASEHTGGVVSGVVGGEYPDGIVCREPACGIACSEPPFGMVSRWGGAIASRRAPKASTSMEAPQLRRGRGRLGVGGSAEKPGKGPIKGVVRGLMERPAQDEFGSRGVEGPTEGLVDKSA